MSNIFKSGCMVFSLFTQPGEMALSLGHLVYNFVPDLNIQTTIKKTEL